MDIAKALKDVFSPSGNAREKEGRAETPAQIEHKSKAKPLSTLEARRMYGRPSSFVQKLPWYEFQTDSKTVLLDDGKSVGAVFDIMPIATEGRSYNWLQNRRDMIQDALQDCFEELTSGPWIIQQYTYDDDDMESYIAALRAYPKHYCKGSEFTQDWLEKMEAHLRGICKEGGLFEDKEVLDAPWSGKIRRIKMS